VALTTLVSPVQLRAVSGGQQVGKVGLGQGAQQLTVTVAFERYDTAWEANLRAVLAAPESRTLMLSLLNG
jgi:hypothetical protein